MRVETMRVETMRVETMRVETMRVETTRIESKNGGWAHCLPVGRCARDAGSRDGDAGVAADRGGAGSTPTGVGEALWQNHCPERDGCRLGESGWEGHERCSHSHAGIGHGRLQLHAAGRRPERDVPHPALPRHQVRRGWVLVLAVLAWVVVGLPSQALAVEQQGALVRIHNYTGPASPPVYQNPKDKGDWPIPLEISCDGRSEYYVVGEIHDCHDTRQVKVTVKGPHASHVWLRVVSGAWLHSKATKYSKTSVTFTTGSGNPNCRPGYPIEVVDIGGRVAGSVGDKHFLEDHQHARGNSQYVTVRHICR